MPFPLTYCFCLYKPPSAIDHICGRAREAGCGGNQVKFFLSSCQRGKMEAYGGGCKETQQLNDEDKQKHNNRGKL